MIGYPETRASQMAPLSNAEKARAYRQRLAAAGEVRLDMVISKAAADALATLAQAQGVTKRAALEELLLASGKSAATEC